MVNLRTLITEAILAESRQSDFREKYPKLDRREADYAIDNDPSDNYKYLDWIGRALTDDPDIRVEDLVKYITVFHNKLKSQDIYKLKTFKDLKHSVETRPMGKKETIEAGAREIVNDDDWLVVAPETHDASRYYGGGTKWCISTGNDEWWNKYYYNNTVIIVKDRNTGEKVAIIANESSGNREYYDSDDHPIGESWYDELPEYVREKIQDYMDSDDPESRSQEYDSKLIDDYIENNGFKDLINDLDSNLENDYSLPENVSGVSLKNHLIYTLGSEEKLTHVLTRVLYETMQYHGRDSIGYISNLEQFREFVRNSAGQEEGSQVENAITNYVLARRNVEKYLEMIQRVVTPQAYQYLYHTLDIDEKIDAAIQSYSKRMNDPQQTRFAQSVIPHSIESVNIENVDDIINVLQHGGYGNEALILRSYMTVKESYRRAIRKLMKLL